MAAKAILVLCAQALLIQSAFSQYLGSAGLAAPCGLAGRGWNYDGLAAPLGLAGRGWNYDGLAAPLGLAGHGWGYDGLAAPLGLAGRGWGYDGLGRGCGCSAIDFTATTGGGLPVASGSCIPPVGVSVASENVYEGILASAGELPFVGTVGVEGVLPTAGAGAVNYGCGNGATAMVATDGLLAPGIGAYGSGIGAYGSDYGLGYGAGWAGRGCGCGCGI